MAHTAPAIENCLLPYDRRIYGLAVKDGHYADLVEAFARRSGLAVWGLPVEVVGEGASTQPAGAVTCVIENLDFQTTLNKINDVLYYQVKPRLHLFLKKDAHNSEQAHFEIVQVKELRNHLPSDRIFESFERVQEADLHDQEILRVFITPRKSTDVRLLTELVLPFLDDVTLAAADASTGKIDFFGRMDQLDKMLMLFERFANVYGTARFRVLPVEHLLPSEALDALYNLVPNLQGAATEVVSRPARERARDRTSEESLIVNSDRVFAFADDKQRVLLVKGLPHKISDVEDALKLIDRSSDVVENVPAVIALQHADATAAAGVLEQAFNMPTSGRKGRRTGTSASAKAKLSITPIGHTNSLILQGPARLVKQASEFVAEHIDVPAVDEDSFRLVPVTHANPVELAELIASLIGKSADKRARLFKAEAAGDTIIISGEPEEMDRAQWLAAQLDGAGASPKAVFTTRVEHAQASQIVQILQDLLLPESSASARSKKLPASRKLHADDASGTVVFVGSPQTWQEQLAPAIAALDQQVGSAPALIIEQVKLQYQKPAVVLESLKLLYPSKKPDTSVRFAPTADGILISGDLSPARMDAIKKTILILDAETHQVSRSLDRFTVHYADVDQLAAAVVNIFDSAPRPRSRKDADDTPFTDHSEPYIGKEITAWGDELTSSLMVLAPPQLMEAIRTFIAETEELKNPGNIPQPDPVPLELYTLEYVGSSRALELYDRLAGTSITGARVDYYDANQLLIEGNPLMCEQSRHLIEEFIDLPQNVRTEPVRRVCYLPPGIPLPELVQVIQSSMPNVELELQDLSLVGPRPVERVPEVKVKSEE